jgi:hypothetical protein
LGFNYGNAERKRAGSSAVAMLASQASVCVDAITVCPPKEREVAGSNPAQSTNYMDSNTAMLYFSYERRSAVNPAVINRNYQQQEELRRSEN